MNLQQIKNAVRKGKTVHWTNSGYTVTLTLDADGTEDWKIVWSNRDQNCIGLTWTDGQTMNGNEDEFYIAENN
jgi:hypothetical protein